MISFIHKYDTLQIMAKNRQQSPNLWMPVESYKIHKDLYKFVNLTERR